MFKNSNQGMKLPSLMGVLAVSWLAMGGSAVAQDFRFDGAISRPVLENYLSRSISFTELLHDDLTQPRDERGVDPHDNLRLILDARAKFVGRALMLWGHESNLALHLKTAKLYAAALHQADPEIVLQAAAFEIITRDVATVSIPERVFWNLARR